jgi:O-acetyl-ADP-ribose deacetylase
MAVTAAADIPTLSLLYKLNKLTAQPSSRSASRRLNDSIGLIRGDITKLAVDAIVNAANQSLLGGGGVDGAIHRAAGPGLLAECRTLNGCQTGSAKITAAYRLPCHKVIHAVGPVYDATSPETSETNLSSCYTKSLELATANGCKTVAFSALSTGVYGYPSKEAAPVAISAVRAFLEAHHDTLDKVVFVTFEMKDVNAYNNSLP